MAGKIKGITIEIGGNTTKLDKSLNDSKQKSKELQKELKGVNSLLKFDPKNTELLNQKQKLLTQSVEETKVRLNTLKEAQAQVTEQFEKGEIGEEAYRDFQREIVNTEQKLKSLEKELSNFGSVGAQKVAAVGEQMKDVGGKVEGAGKKMSKISGAIVAVGGASVAAFKEMDAGYDVIVEKTGATGAALDDMKNIAENLFTKLPVEMADVGAAVGEVNTRFGLTGKALEGTSEQFLKFAKINNTDVSNSIDLVQKSLAAFNLDGSHAGEMLDVINSVAQETGISVENLSQLIVTNAATMRELGFNAQQSATFLGNLEKSGIDSSAVLTGLKTAMKNAAKDGKTLDEGLSELEFTMKNSKDSQEAMSAAVELFGAKAGPQLASAIQNGVISFKDLTTAADKSKDSVGSVSQTFESTIDPVDEAKTTMNELTTTAADLGNTLLTSVQPILSSISSKVSQFSNWFKELDDGTKQRIVMIAGIVAAIGPLLIIVGKVIGSVGTILTIAPKVVNIVKTVGTAVKGLFALLSANPIGIVIAAIAALIAIFVSLYKHNEKFRSFVDGIWNKIKSVFGALPGWFSEKMNSIQTKVKTGLNNIKNWFANVKLKLGPIKLPHFKLAGSFSLKPPSVPKLSVDWYAKAMDEGMILNSPTIFGVNRNGQPMGGGEVGSETIVGTESLMSKIKSAVRNEMANFSADIFIWPDKLVGGTADKMNEALGAIAVGKGRGH